MPFFERDSKKYLFVHIPKCGGSAIENHLEKHSNKFFYCDLNPLRPISNSSPQHFPIQDLRLFFGDDFWESAFSVVRDPYERIESEFFFQKKYLNLKENDFNRWLHSAFELFQDNPFHLDNHLRPQTYFIDETVTIFRYEYGINNISKAIEEIMGFRTMNFPPVVLPSGRGIIDWSARSLELMRTFYASDFEKFRYPIR